MKKYRKFNPYRMFRGTFVPEPLAELPVERLSHGAKLAYGRLMRYAGKNGYANPKRETLAKKIGLCVRQLDYLLDELREFPLIETVQRGRCRSNIYHFLWNDEVFGDAIRTEGVNSQHSATQDLQDSASAKLQNGAEPNKESQSKRIKSKIYTASAENINEEELKIQVPFQFFDIVVAYRQKIDNTAPFTKKAESLIRSREKEYSKQELLEAIERFSQDEWRMNNNSHLGMEWFFKDEEQVAKWLMLRVKPKREVIVI